MSPVIYMAEVQQMTNHFYVLHLHLAFSLNA